MLKLIKTQMVKSVLIGAAVTLTLPAMASAQGASAQDSQPASVEFSEIIVSAQRIAKRPSQTRLDRQEKTRSESSRIMPERASRFNVVATGRAVRDEIAQPELNFVAPQIALELPNFAAQIAS